MRGDQTLFPLCRPVLAYVAGVGDHQLVGAQMMGELALYEHALPERIAAERPVQALCSIPVLHIAACGHIAVLAAAYRLVAWGMSVTRAETIHLPWDRMCLEHQDTSTVSPRTWVLDARIECAVLRGEMRAVAGLGKSMFQHPEVSTVA